MDISLEGIEIQFPEENPLAVRESKTTSRGKQRRYRVPGKPGPQVESIGAHTVAQGPPRFSSGGSWDLLPASSPSSLLLLYLYFLQLAQPKTQGSLPKPKNLFA